MVENQHINLSERSDIEEFFKLYLKHMAYGSSFILGAPRHVILTSITCFVSDVDFVFRYSYPAVFYLSGIVTYLFGRIIVSFFIGWYTLSFPLISWKTFPVMLMDVFKITNYLEVRYQEVLSQVNSYMSSKHFPVAIQSKVRHFYDHRYQGKYLNEQRVEKFISGTLITLHFSCSPVIPRKTKKRNQISRMSQADSQRCNFPKAPTRNYGKHIAVLKKGTFHAGRYHNKCWHDWRVYVFYVNWNCIGGDSIRKRSETRLCHFHLNHLHL